MPCDLDPRQLPPAMAHNQKREQPLKYQRRHNAHIDDRNRLSVISQKRPSAL
jgi:hypothetical protein